MKDLYATTGQSPGISIEKYCETAAESALISKSGTSYDFREHKIEWTVHNHYYIHQPTPLFENKIYDKTRLLTKEEISRFLNVSIKMIDRKVALHEIPFLKIGKLVRFDKETVLRWAKENITKG